MAHRNYRSFWNDSSCFFTCRYVIRISRECESLQFEIHHVMVFALGFSVLVRAQFASPFRSFSSDIVQIILTNSTKSTHPMHAGLTILNWCLLRFLCAQQKKTLNGKSMWKHYKRNENNFNGKHWKLCVYLRSNDPRMSRCWGASARERERGNGYVDLFAVLL